MQNRRNVENEIKKIFDETDPQKASNNIIAFQSEEITHIKEPKSSFNPSVRNYATQDTSENYNNLKRIGRHLLNVIASIHPALSDKNKNTLANLTERNKESIASLCDRHTSEDKRKQAIAHFFQYEKANFTFKEIKKAMKKNPSAENIALLKQFTQASYNALFIELKKRSDSWYASSVERHDKNIKEIQNTIKNISEFTLAFLKQRKLDLENEQKSRVQDRQQLQAARVAVQDAESKRSSTAEDATKLQEKLHGLQKQIDELKAKDRSNLQTIEDQLKQASADHGGLQEKIKNQKTEISELKQFMRKREAEIRGSAGELARLEAKNEELEKSYQEAKAALLASRAALKEANSTIADLKKKNRALTQENNKIKDQIKPIREELNAALADVAKLKKQIPVLKKQVENAQEAETKEKERADGLAGKIDALKKSQAKKIEELNDKHKAAIAEQKEKNETDKENLNATHETAEEKLKEKHDAAVAELNKKHKAAVAKSKKELADLKAKNKKTDTENTKLLKQVADLKLEAKVQKKTPGDDAQRLADLKKLLTLYFKVKVRLKTNNFNDIINYIIKKMGNELDSKTREKFKKSSL